MFASREAMRCLMFVCAVTVSLSEAGAKTVYVDRNANGRNDGSSWENAYKYLQDALKLAVSHDEIHVAQGLYRPDRGTRYPYRPYGNGDQDAVFTLRSYNPLRGGYGGSTAPDPNERDFIRFASILSGDIGFGVILQTTVIM